MLYVSTLKKTAAVSALFAIPIIATGACYKASTPVSCCSFVGSFDGVGNCSPWAHSCPDVASSNPVARQVVSVPSDQGDAAETIDTTLVCTYQPVKCKFIGCASDGPIATGTCLDQIPNTQVPCESEVIR